MNLLILYKRAIPSLRSCKDGIALLPYFLPFEGKTQGDGDIITTVFLYLQIASKKNQITVSR